MILIDAIFIHIGGPKILLDYLISELEKTDKSITYLLDNRVKGKIQSIKPENKVVYQQAKLIERNKFYIKHRNSFSTVLCMANIPPNIRLRATVYTYFHNSPFLEYIKGFSIRKNILFSLKRMVVNHYRKNTDFWIVQTNLIGEKLSKKYNLNIQQIFELPFYEPVNQDALDVSKIKGQYTYVSLGVPYKNHLRLITAFCLFYDKHQYGKLIVTLPPEFKDILQQIEQKKKAGYPIENVGYIDRKNVQKLFLESEYHVFPSLTESLGLGILESIDCGCKVIGADLPYMHAVCEPSVVFDPFNVEAIVGALKQSIEKDLPLSKSKVKNQIKELLSLLK